GDIELNVEWQLDFGFGLDFKDGFYLVIDGKELLFDISVQLPAAIRGTLGFLELRAQDKDILVDHDDPDSVRHTELGATFAVDIFEKDASGDPLPDNPAVDGEDGDHLGFTEFGSIGIDVGIAAEASAMLGLELGLSDDLFVEIFGGGASSVISGFPKIQSDFLFLWELGTRDGDSLAEIAANEDTEFISFTDIGDSIADGLKLVEFRDVGLDLGSFLSDVLGPIVEEVSAYTEPLQPIIDFITSPIPIIGDLGLEITWLDLAAQLAGPSFNVGLIQSIAEVITLINDIAALSSAGEVILPIGDMVIFDADASFTPDLSNPNLNLGDTFDQIQGATGLLDNLIGNAGGIANALTGLAGSGSGNAATANTLKNVVSGQAAGGFHFPLFEDPTQIFGLLMGEPADLVTYDVGAFNFSFEFSQFFSIFGPLGVSIGLLVEVMADTAFGYDTQGIMEFVDSGFTNPLLLFDGFFISDSPKLDGNDDPELTFLAQLTAAAELNLGIARAGVAAALGFTIEFDLFDPNDDLKIRFAELLGNIENQLKAPGAEKLLAPLAIFDVSGEIFAKLFAFLKIDFGFFSFSKDFPIYGPVTLLDFDIDFFRPPLLASEVDANGNLIINTSENAEQRLLGNATDVGEHLVIESHGISGGFVDVTVRSANGALGDDADVDQEYRVKVGSKIIIDGGDGDDTFDLTGFDADGVIFEIDLGAGNDTVLWNDSAEGVAGAVNVIIGGSGDDHIQGSGGNDQIFGGSGNDTIHAGAGDDLVFGDEGEIGAESARGLVRPTDGRDQLFGEGDKDILFGGGGKDSLSGGDEDDLLLGGGGVVFFNSPPLFDNLRSLTEVSVDGTEKAPFDTTAGDTLSGGGGSNIIYGTAGPDTLTGSTGNDLIFGLGGIDTIDGREGNDIIFGDGGKLKLGAGGFGTATGGSATLLNDAGAHFMSDGVKAGDYVYNDTEGTFVRVVTVISDTSVETEPVDNWDGDGYTFFVPAVISGSGDARDVIQGYSGDDLIFGGGGGDQIQGGDGDDNIFGGSGPDVIFGDNGSIISGVPTPAFGPGDGNDIIFGEGEPDKIYGGAGIDQIDGGVGSDIVKAGADSDVI